MPNNPNTVGGRGFATYRSYLSGWRDFWSDRVGDRLDHATAIWNRARDKDYPVNKLAGDVFDWWSEVFDIWLDAGWRSLGPGESDTSSGGGAGGAALVRLLAGDDDSKVNGHFDTTETDAPSADLVGFDGKDRNAHLEVQLLNDGRAEVTFSPKVTTTGGPQIIPDGLYYGVVRKANSLDVLATVWVLKKKL